MPELPEVETTRRGIAPHVEGQTIKSIHIRNPKLRWPVDTALEQTLPAQRIQGISRRGKYLLFEFDTGTALWHLGMSGSLRILSGDVPAGKHDHIDWQFDNGALLRYNDPRRFGALLWTAQAPALHPLLAHLGPEPLSDEFNAQYLFDRSRGRGQAIKTFIMDATVVVGVGNIYANEALFAAGVHPLKAAGKLTRPQCARLCEHIKRILHYAITRGGTTLRDFVGGDGKPGYFAQELQVYGRGTQACKACGKALTEKRVAQRTTVFCTRCQRK